jgi:hypothetical protein
MSRLASAIGKNQKIYLQGEYIMRLIILSLISGFLILTASTEAFPFGRGGGAPPRGGGGGFHGGGGGGGHGIAAGPYGGVHAPVESGGGRGMVTRPVGGEIIRPTGGYRAGGEMYGGVHAEPGGYRPTINGAGEYRGGVAGAGGAYGGGVYGGTRAGHSTNYIRPSALQALGRGIGGREYPYFTRDWYGRHAGAWFPGIWAGGYGLWDVPVWDNIAPYVGIVGLPIDYDYGSTAVIQDDTMYLNGEPIGPAADYASQALSLGDAARAATVGDSDQWEPLGVFGLMQSNDSTPVRIFQLAVNKGGIVRGNYYDAVLDTNLPVYGQVDKKSQRVVWSIGDRKDIVYEAGLNNLLQGQTTVLIHFGKDRTQQMILVRIPAPQLPPPQQTSQPPQLPPQK